MEAIVTLDGWPVEPVLVQVSLDRPGRQMLLLRVAEAYVALIGAGDRRPARTWADRQGMSVRTVQTQIRKARDAGLLSRSPNGQVGGELTPLALDLLRRIRHTTREGER